jgi:hypothetical protein
MIVPAQMQYAMNQKRHQFFINAALLPAGLADGLRQGNDDVSKHGGRWTGPLPHRKGQHIRRPISVTKGVIQTAHSAITDNFQTKKCVGFIHRLENLVSHVCEGTKTKLPPSKPHADHHRH